MVKCGKENEMAGQFLLLVINIYVFARRNLFIISHNDEKEVICKCWIFESYGQVSTEWWNSLSSKVIWNPKKSLPIKSLGNANIVMICWNILFCCFCSFNRLFAVTLKSLLTGTPKCVNKVRYHKMPFPIHHLFRLFKRLIQTNMPLIWIYLKGTPDVHVNFSTELEIKYTKSKKKLKPNDRNQRQINVIKGKYGLMAKRKEEK